MPVSLGVIADSRAEPLFRGFRKSSVTSRYTIHEASSAELALRLREHALDGAFLSPIDFARNHSEYTILPDVAWTSTGRSGMAVLVFNEDLRRLESITIDPRYTSEVVLTHLLLVEKFGISPRFIPSTENLDTSLQTHNAVLLVGDAVQLAGTRANRLDLIEEWTDLYELPFVHGLWVMRENAVSAADAAAILGRSKAGLSSIISSHQASPGVVAEECGYEMTDDARESINEYFRLAYYHGILEDIPDVKIRMTGGSYGDA